MRLSFAFRRSHLAMATLVSFVAAAAPMSASAVMLDHDGKSHGSWRKLAEESDSAEPALTESVAAGEAPTRPTDLNSCKTCHSVMDPKIPFGESEADVAKLKEALKKDEKALLKKIEDRLKSSDAAKVMPRSGKLSDEKIKKIMDYLKSLADG